MTTSGRPGAKRPAGSEGWGLTPSPGGAVSLPSSREQPLPGIEKGHLVVMRQFDVASEIDLVMLERLAESSRQGLKKVRSTALTLSAPPVAVSLGSVPVTLADRPFMAQCVARFFDFGVVSVRMWLTLPTGIAWTDMAALVSEAQDAEALTNAATEAVATSLKRFEAAIHDAHESAVDEDYLVAFIERFEDGQSPTTLPRDAIARLLLGEPASVDLSEAEMDEAVEHRSSYSTSDLCVSGWNTALVIDPDGDTDPIDVLELANAQLLELRFYDGILDRELGVLYDETENRKGRMPALFRNYGPVLRRAMTVMLEIAEFIERVENSLKIIGDVYLARLYAGAVEALRIPAWERSVTRKQKLVQQVYDVLKAEVDASRDQLLELTIVVLIVGEIAMVLGGLT